jgi:multicomponent Na+:H+ antiporter subunit E
MLTGAGSVSTSLIGSEALRRFVIYLAFWLVLIQFSAVNLIVGIVTSVAATWFSFRLQPAPAGQISYVALVRLTLHSLWQSLVAGLDVARRALNPRLPLEIGYVRYRTNLSDGGWLNAFRAVTSLQPGTLPVNAEDERDIVFHCLDVRQPIAADLAKAEELFDQLMCQKRVRGEQDG